MIKITTIILSIGMLAACGSTNETASNNDESQKVASNKDMVCEQTATTGSHLKKKRCMSKKVAETVREVNRDNIRALNRSQQIGPKDKR